MKVFTLSMVFGMAVASVAFAQGSTLTSGYTKANQPLVSAPAKAPTAQAAKTTPRFIKVSAEAKAPTYIYKAPMATRPLKTW